MPITIVQGAQYGSEGKGAVAGALALRLHFDYAVRTGAINAGHTVYFEGKPYAMQQLPVAWVRPDTKLVIGPGAYVHYPTLIGEIEMIRNATGEDPSSRIYIDRRVGVHLDSYAQESADVNRHHLIGATGKGCAEAIIHKIKDRGKDNLLLIDQYPIAGPWRWANVPEMLTTAYENDEKIMLEGTQGELLDFHLGPWPFVTSRQTTAAAWVAETGLSPALDYDIILVARCYPIRVAGNSGFLPYETTWPNLARRTNLDLGGKPDHPMYVDPKAIAAYEGAVDIVGEAVGVNDLGQHCGWDKAQRYAYRDLLSEYSNKAFSMISDDHQRQLRKLFEFTTVTKKLRRVAFLDVEGLRRTIGLVKPGYTVLTFLNYRFPLLYGGTELTSEARLYAKGVHENIMAVTTGPLSSDLVWLPSP